MKPTCTYCGVTEEYHSNVAYCTTFTPKLSITDKLNRGEKEVSIREISLECAHLLLNGTEDAITNMMDALVKYIDTGVSQEKEAYLSALFDTLAFYSYAKAKAKNTQEEVQHLIKVLGL